MSHQKTHSSPVPPPNPSSTSNRSAPQLTPPASQIFLPLRGRIDAARFEQEMGNRGLSVADKKAVFIFPGNTGHHGPSHTLFSQKSGNGLGVPAGELGAKGWPVLSLPTTGMGQWPKNQLIAQKAVADLWRAVGAGYSLVLPVRQKGNVLRDKNNTNSGKYDANYFFDGSLNIQTANHEPSFWGYTETKANKELGNYYLNHLNLLNTFMNTPEDQKQDFFANIPNIPNQDRVLIEQAYKDGLKFKAGTLNDATKAAWFTSGKAELTSKVKFSDNALHELGFTSDRIKNDKGEVVYKKAGTQMEIHLKQATRVDEKHVYELKNFNQVEYEKFIEKLVLKGENIQITKADKELVSALEALNTKYATHESVTGKAQAKTFKNLLEEAKGKQKAPAPEANPLADMFSGGARPGRGH